VLLRRGKEGSVSSASVSAQASRPRRTTLAVPGSSERFIVKARDLPVDEIFLDLEDAVAPAAKTESRALVVRALTGGGWGTKLRAVRVNDVRTGWAHRDVLEVVEQAGDCLDVIVLPKVAGPLDIGWLDLLISQIELDRGLEPGRIGIEAQIEDAAGLAAVDDIAAASPRLQALVFGPADFMASLGMRSLAAGTQPAGYTGGDAFHYPLMRILVAARSRGLQAIDGPYAAIGDDDGLRRSAAAAAALGYDGKWVVHPSQIDLVNAEFSPSQADYDRAELLLDAYDYCTRQGRGAARLDGEMIDEASRKLAEVAAARGRAAGLTRTTAFQPPAVPPPS
jgi:citrate lyase subunit beta / citryl-CoA lyase